jgi:GNAT superfamily N-acetyltransferase
VTGVADRRSLAVVVSDAGTKQVVGGIWGRTELGLVFFDMFFLPETLRARGLGAQLLLKAEEEARRRGCARAVVETSSFQAPHFYEKHGYSEFGRVDFELPGHARIFLRKELR